MVSKLSKTSFNITRSILDVLSVVECFQSGPHFPPKTIIKQQKSADFLSLGVGRLPYNAAIEVFASLIALPWPGRRPDPGDFSVAADFSVAVAGVLPDPGPRFLPKAWKSS